MKKIVITGAGIIIILALACTLMFNYIFTTIDRESEQGLYENNQAINLDNITEPLVITYMGDSLTAGELSDGTIDEELGYRGYIHQKLSEQNLVDSEYNFAVSGYTIEDLILQVETNTHLSEVNQQLQDIEDSEDTSQLYPTDIPDDISVREALSNSDVLVVTIGANDILELINYTNGEFDINMNNLFAVLRQVHDLKVKLFKEIHMINPELKIYDVGMYMAYSGLEENMMRRLYPLLVYSESKLFINDETSNIYRVVIRDNFQSNLSNYVDNPDNIHPNRLGYDVMGSEILKKISQTIN